MDLSGFISNIERYLLISGYVLSAVLESVKFHMLFGLCV